MVKKPLLIFFLFSLLSQLSAANCIGVVTAGGGVSFWKDVEAGALLAAKEFAIKVIVRGPKDEADTRSQKLIIEQMINMGCKGLVLAPNARERVEQAKALIENNIKVVFIDRNLGEKTIHTVKTNNLLAGELAASELIKHLKPDAKIALLRMDEKVQSTTERESGFKAEIEKAGLKLVVETYIGINPSDAMLNAYSIFEKHPEIDAVFTPNESTTIAAMHAKKRLTAHQPILHVGFDASDAIRASIKSDELLGVVVQQPYLMGYLGVQNTMALLSGNEVVQHHDTPVRFLTKESLKEHPGF